jgi:hypothetical protein
MASFHLLDRCRGRRGIDNIIVLIRIRLSDSDQAQRVRSQGAAAMASPISAPARCPLGRRNAARRACLAGREGFGVAVQAAVAITGWPWRKSGVLAMITGKKRAL